MTTERTAAVGVVDEPVESVRQATMMRPYAPSWADVLMRWIERIPGPTWFAYVLLLAASLLVASTEGWVAGLSTFPAVDPVQTGFGLFFTTPLAVMHYLNGVAGDAWDRFRPATDLDDAVAARQRYELTVTPRRAAGVLVVVGYIVNALYYVSDPVGTGVAGQNPLFVATREVVEGFITSVVLVLVYQVIRQLRIVSRLHRSVSRIDLFQPASLHAMSRLTARNALGIIALAIFIDIPYPGTEALWVTTTLTFALPMLILALVAFFLPLRGLHARLSAEKGRMDMETTARLEATIHAIHEVVDDETVNRSDVERSRLAQTRVDALSKAQSSLIQERDVVGKLSTWPWETNTLRAVVSAVVLPIGLFLLTRVLDKAL